jgi:hypothetical protein
MSHRFLTACIKLGGAIYVKTEDFQAMAKWEMALVLSSTFCDKKVSQSYGKQLP